MNRAARALLALGVERGDRVGIWSPNCAEWVITQYAAAKVGAILVNVNPAYRLRELEYALRQSGVRVLIASRGFRTTDYVEMLRADAGAVRASAGPRSPSDGSPALATWSTSAPNRQPGGLAWTDFMELGDAVDARELAPAKRPCNSTTPSTSNTPPARPARRKARRSRTTTS